MKLEGRKVFGFIIGMIVLSLMYVSLLIFAKDMLQLLGGYIIGAITTIILTFIGANSVDKIMKSVFYKKELDNDREEET